MMDLELFGREWNTLVLGCLVLLLAAVASGSSCDNTVIRQANVYETELNFFEKASLDQSDHLVQLISDHCVCELGVFTNKNCQEAADTAVVVRARIPWHKQMARYNAGLEKDPPSETPPEIPKASTLCPGGE